MNLVRIAWLIAPLLVGLSEAAAQHHEHQPSPGGGETHAAGAAAMHEARTGVLGIPMTRHGSGTAWLPDDSPMRALHARVGGWDMMVHGNLFVGYTCADHGCYQCTCGTSMTKGCGSH